MSYSNKLIHSNSYPFHTASYPYHTYFALPAETIVPCVLLTTLKEKYGTPNDDGNMLCLYTHPSEEGDDPTVIKKCVQQVQADKLKVVKATIHYKSETFQRNVYLHVDSEQLFITQDEYGTSSDLDVAAIGKGEWARK